MSTHKHKCDGCGFVWEHSDDCHGNTEAHICVCGREQWWRYSGSCLPKFVGCGRPVLQAVKKAVKRSRRVVEAVCDYCRPKRRRKIAA